MAKRFWTSEAHSADWIFALVRTGEGSSGRNGISFILADLTTLGISRRQIADISGNDELCEVFFDDVRVPLDNVVGRLNDGWAVATTLLAEERIRAGGPWHSLRALERLRAIVRFKGLSNDSYALDRLAQAEIEVATMCASYLDALERLEQGKTEAKDSSYIKILGTETTQFVLDVAQELAGSARAVKRPFRCSAGYVDFSEFFLQSRRLSIYGGSNEIQRTLLAMRALGLPKGAA